MPILLTCLFFLLNIVVGWMLTTWMGLKISLEKLGASVLLGLWLITLTMMVAYQATTTFSLELTFGLSLGLNLLLFLLIGPDNRLKLKQEITYIRSNTPYLDSIPTH